MMSWSRCSLLILALHDSTKTATCHRMAGGVMQERIGNWFIGVARSVPEIVHMALLRAASSLWVWELQHQTGARYSTAEKTSACVEICRVIIAALHVVPASQSISAAHDVTFAVNFSRCWRYISERSSFTQRYIGVALNW